MSAASGQVARSGHHRNKNEEGCLWQHDRKPLGIHYRMSNRNYTKERSVSDCRSPIPVFGLGRSIIGAILTLLFLPFSRGRLRAIYEERFKESRRERLFLGSLGFFVTVFVVRGITIAIHKNIGPFHDVSMHGRHIHHMVWGILLLLIVGYCWLSEIGTGSADSSPIAGRITAMLYGVAAALILDEFALWLNLSDVYWQREGRESYEAMALFGSLLAVGLFGGPLLKGLAKEVSRRKTYKT